jgi:hypothetical protein
MARRRRRGAKKVFGKELDDLILSRPETGITMREIAERVGCALGTVQVRHQKLKTAMIKRGVPPETVNRELDRGKGWSKGRAATKTVSVAQPAPTTVLDVPDPSLTRVERARKLEVLTDEDTEKVLTCLVHDEVAPAVTVQALKNLADLKAKNRPAERKGPPDPLNRHERVERLAVLLDCAGKDESGEAWEKAFGEKKDVTGRQLVHSESDTGDRHITARYLRDGD